MNRPRFSIAITLHDTCTGERVEQCYDLADYDMYRYTGLTPPGSFESLGMGNSFESAIEKLRKRDERRDFFRNIGGKLGYALACFMEDKEGWHGEERKRIIEEAKHNHRVI